MTKRRPRPTTPAAAGAAPAPQPAAPTWYLLDGLAIAAAALCIALGWLSWYALNPDGVSYLDMSGALERGDWSHFVQGYWSPLYPFVIGVIGKVAGLHGAPLIGLTHLVNTVVALATLGIIWWWARQRGQRAFGYLAIGGFLLVSAGVPRIEAVTPDVLLLLIATWLSYEIIVQRGQRWWLTGLLLGAAYLAKTSSWPWLIVAWPLLWWCADASLSFVRRAQPAFVCMAVMLVWVIPLSHRYARPTLGSSGALNYSWYIDANTSRLPDSDRGENRAYRSVSVTGAAPLTLALFDQWPSWTYQPWGDPTGWHDNVISESGRPPTPTELLSYWLRLAGRVFGLWTLPAIIAVIVPGYWLRKRPGAWHELWHERRREAVVGTLGLIGLLQFTAVHAEPRLLAPFAMMLTLGVLSWSFASTDHVSTARPWVTRLLPWLGVATAAVFAVPKFDAGVASYQRLARAIAQLSDVKSRAAAEQMPLDRIAVIGPAAPVLSAAYWLGAHVVAQIPPESAGRLKALPPLQQRDLLIRLFGGRVPMVWETSADGGMQMLVIPTRPDSS